MKKLIVPALAAALVAGCNTVAISSKGSLEGIDVKGAGGQADRTLCVGNEAYFLFNWLPLFSSSMDWDRDLNGVNTHSLSLFSDDTSLESVSKAFYKYAERENCDVVNIVIDNQTHYPIGLSGLGALCGNVISVHDMYVTGVLKPRVSAAKPATAVKK